MVVHSHGLPAGLKPTPIDAFPTATSREQHETEASLLKYNPLSSESSSSSTSDTPSSQTTTSTSIPKNPTLDKKSHLQFLARNFIQGFPARYQSQDVSQPWLMFFTLQGFSILQTGLDPGNRERAIKTILQLQHPGGGFSGAPHLPAHLLSTYAAVCSLAIIGKPGPGGGWDEIDRVKMYHWFMSLKLDDGSFLVSYNAEVDSRGIYCLLTTAILLNILTPELIANTATFISSCQTYEGGFSNASQTCLSISSNSNPNGDQEPNLVEEKGFPLGESHGGYTFCSLASWVMLLPFIDSSPSPADKSVPIPISQQTPSIDLKNLLRWLVQMQGIEVELGGFRGRTNKLVDGCYSWWVAGCFIMLEALGVGRVNDGTQNEREEVQDSKKSDDDEANWDDVDDALFNRKALQEYLLYACQHPAGGLRDKPSKHPDAYHTLYCLSGLATAQHQLYPSPSRKQQLEESWKDVPDPDPSIRLPSHIRKEVFASSLSWIEEEGHSKIIGGTGNRVNATHPLFDLTVTHTEGIMSYFYGQTIPERKREKR